MNTSINCLWVVYFLEKTILVREVFFRAVYCEVSGFTSSPQDVFLLSSPSWSNAITILLIIRGLRFWAATSLPFYLHTYRLQFLFSQVFFNTLQPPSLRPSSPSRLLYPHLHHPLLVTCSYHRNLCFMNLPRQLSNYNRFSSSVGYPVHPCHPTGQSHHFYFGRIYFLFLRLFWLPNFRAIQHGWPYYCFIDFTITLLS